MSKVFEMAKKYYPRLWPESRIRALVQAGRLTQAQAEEILMDSNRRTATFCEDRR